MSVSPGIHRILYGLGRICRVLFKQKIARKRANEKGKKELDTRFKPFIVANEVMHDAKKAQDLLQEHGYLFFRGVMDTEVIQALRQDILRLCQQAGWLDATSPLESGTWNGKVAYYTDGAPEFLAVYHQVLKLPSFQQFPTTYRFCKFSAHSSPQMWC